MTSPGSGSYLAIERIEPHHQEFLRAFEHHPQGSGHQLHMLSIQARAHRGLNKAVKWGSSGRPPERCSLGRGAGGRHALLPR